MRADRNDDVFEISEIDKIIYCNLRELAARYTPGTKDSRRNKFLDRYCVYCARGYPCHVEEEDSRSG